MFLRCVLFLFISVFAADLERAAKFQNRLTQRELMSDPETRRGLEELQKLAESMEREDFVKFITARFATQRRNLFLGEVLCGITGACDDIQEKAKEFVCNGDHSCEAFETLGLAIHSLAELTLEHLREIDLQDLLDLIEEVWNYLQCKVAYCLTDFDIHGCMLGDNRCEITYGDSCLAVDHSVGAAVTSDLNGATKHSEGSVAFYAGAEASMQTQGLLILDLANGANFRVQLTMPEIDINAKAKIEFTASGDFDSGEKRVELAQKNEFFAKVFMAGAVPVMLKMAIQPVAILSAKGNVNAAGHVTYSVNGNIGFDVGGCSDTPCPVYIEVPLDFSGVVNNFKEEITPTITVDHGFDWDFSGTADLNLEARVGVELSISVQNIIEFNLFPSVKTTFQVNGNIEKGKDADALAGASGSLCFAADFEAYLDYAETKNGRRALGTRVNILDTIDGLCEGVFDALECPILDDLGELTNVCGLARGLLKELGFPEYIEMPDLPKIPTELKGSVCETFEATITSSDGSSGGSSSGNGPQPSLPSPSTQFRALDGCSRGGGLRRGQRPRWARMNQRFEVQCCAHNGRRCTRYHRRNQCISGRNDAYKMNWHQAKNACASIGMRLCRSQSELNRCCRSGCAHDADLVWTGIRRR